MNRKSPFVPLARTASLSMALALFGCSEESKRPPPPSAVTVFKEAPSEPTDTSPAPQASPTPTAKAEEGPEQLFFRMGCKACHGPSSAYGSVLAQARAKPAEEIAKWILHPELIRPGTLMPSYARRLSEEQALTLARWIKAGNPVSSP